MSLKNIQLYRNVDLSAYTKFKIPSLADCFLKINSAQDIAEVIRDFGFSFYVLGNGSNILLASDVIKKPVVYLSDEMSYIAQRGQSLYVGAATPLARLLGYCIKYDIGGFSNLAGIPARLGGLVRMNASSYGVNISDYLIGVEIADKSGGVKFIKKEDIAFTYRNAALDDQVILKAEFLLARGFSVRQEINHFLKKRLAVQDFSFPSCGCIFRNPDQVSAGLLIEDCGLKGYCRGGARVSAKHANFIINTGKATYNDVDYLIQKIKLEVWRKHNILLEEEIKRWH